MKRTKSIGIYFGCFIPLHAGHMNAIEMARRDNDKVILGVTGFDQDRGKDFIPFLRRVRLMKEIYPSYKRTKVVEIDDKKLRLTGTFSYDAWQKWCKELFEQAGLNPDNPNIRYTWYMGEQAYLDKISAIYPKHFMYLLNRNQIAVSGTAIRNSLDTFWDDIHPRFQEYLIQQGIPEQKG